MTAENVRVEGSSEGKKGLREEQQTLTRISERRVRVSSGM